MVLYSTSRLLLPIRSRLTRNVTAQTSSIIGSVQESGSQMCHPLAHHVSHPTPVQYCPCPFRPLRLMTRRDASVSKQCGASSVPAAVVPALSQLLPARAV